ncbi:sialidase family protein [Kordiimonas sp.]|uniref:sialidase family protein n=1 Tax=Kordiimonas sp. TaxID=1970157 RepID=UPI003A8D2C0B
MAIRIIEHRTLYRDDHFYSAFPAVLALPSGDVLLAFRRAPDHRWLLGDAADKELNAVDHVHFRSHIAMVRFDEGLAVKREAYSLPSYPEAGDQDANLFLTSSGRLLQYGFLWYPVTYEIAEKLKEMGRAGPLMADRYGAGYIYWASYSRFSTDEGHSWSDHKLMPRDPLIKAGRDAFSPYSSALRGRMVERSDGSLLMPAYNGSLSGHDLPAVRFFQSYDGGINWEVKDTLISLPEISLAEPALAQWPAGALTVFNRTGHNDDHLITATSFDDGETFSAPESVGIKGHPFDPLVLPDGRLFLVYGYRHDPMGVRARLVEPGQRLEDAEELVLRADSASKDVGYPSATLLSGGQILIAYYIADERGVRGIDGTLVAID